MNRKAGRVGDKFRIVFSGMIQFVLQPEAHCMRAGFETAPEQWRLSVGRGDDADGCNRDAPGDWQVTPEGREDSRQIHGHSVIELARDIPWHLVSVPKSARSAVVAGF
jgi:hypothetical protein